jgi:hypothetical protein
VKGQNVSSLYTLYRRSYGLPAKRFCNPDGSATSRVFKLREKDKGELSVDIKELTTVESAIVNKTSFMLFEIPVSSVLKLNLSAIHDPLTDNDAHAYIGGLDINDDIKPSQLAKASKKVL